MEKRNDETNNTSKLVKVVIFIECRIRSVHKKKDSKAMQSETEFLSFLVLHTDKTTPHRKTPQIKITNSKRIVVTTE